MKNTFKKMLLNITVSLFLSIALFSLSAFADTFTWDGDSDSDWCNGINWQGDPMFGPGEFDDVDIVASTMDPDLSGCFSGQTVNSLTITSGTLNMSNYSLTITGSGTGFAGYGGTINTGGSNGDFDVDNNASFHGVTFNNNSADLNIDGNLSMNSGTINSNTGTVTVDGTFTKTGGTFDTDTATVTLKGTSSNSSGAFNNGNSGTLDIQAVFTLSGGTFAQGSKTVQTDGMTVSGGTYTGGAGSITVDGTLTKSTGGALNGSTGTIDVNGDVTITGGTLQASSTTTTVSGNFTRSSGTFTHNSGTVNLDGTNQSLGGNITFNNLTKNVTSAYTLTFAANDTITVLGTSNFSGIAANLLSIRSSSDGTHADFDPQGTRTFNYLDVQDNQNVNATPIDMTGLNSVGGQQNNIEWNNFGDEAAGGGVPEFSTYLYIGTLFICFYMFNYIRKENIPNTLA